ncbi:MAG: DUF1489 family protein [Rhizomicrobium sp.]
MTLHILKLCVGVETVDELAQWQAGRVRDQKKRGVKTPELVHVTRMMPKRKDEILDGGSLYWVIKGQIAVRQTLIDIRRVTKNGTPHCGWSTSPSWCRCAAAPTVPSRAGAIFPRRTRRPTRVAPRASKSFPKGCRPNWSNWGFSSAGGSHRHVVDQPRRADLGRRENPRRRSRLSIVSRLAASRIAT